MLFQGMTSLPPIASTKLFPEMDLKEGDRGLEALRKTVVAFQEIGINYHAIPENGNQLPSHTLSVNTLLKCLQANCTPDMYQGSP